MNRKKRRDAKKLKCSSCGSIMSLEYSVKYQKMFYRCLNNCDCAVSAHPNGEPVGIPAPKVVRELRQYAHSLANKIWKYKDSDKRNKMYKWLESNSKSGHIGKMEMDELGEVIGKFKKIITKYNL